MKYRKKPIVIEAFQFDGDFIDRDGKPYVPEWAIDAHNHGRIWFSLGDLHIQTLEGAMTATAGDYIIQGIKGEIYPCKEDIFNATYEQVN